MADSERLRNKAEARETGGVWGEGGGGTLLAMQHS